MLERRGCPVIKELVASFKAEKRKVNVGDAWFRVSTLSLSLSLSLSLNWSSGLQTAVCLLLIRVRWQEICLLHRFSLLIGSDWVFFVFYREGHGLAEKLLLTIFIFWQISSTIRCALILCADTPFLHFEESLSTDNIRWMLSWAPSCNHYFFLCAIN